MVSALRTALSLVVIAYSVACLLALETENNFALGALMRIDWDPMAINALENIYYFLVAIILENF